MKSSSALLVESVIHILGGLVALSERSINLVIEVQVLAVVFGANVQCKLICSVLDVKDDLVLNVQLSGV